MVDKYVFCNRVYDIIIERISICSIHTYVIKIGISKRKIQFYIIGKLTFFQSYRSYTIIKKRPTPVIMNVKVKTDFIKRKRFISLIKETGFQNLIGDWIRLCIGWNFHKAIPQFHHIKI